MTSALAIAAGSLCVVYFTGTMLSLGVRAAGPPGPRARDARTGRPLRIRVDRRLRRSRRATDRLPGTR